MKKERIIRASWIAGFAISALFGLSPAREASADIPGIDCEREVTADLVVIDQPLMFNRMGAANVNGMIYSLRRDVIDNTGIPLTVTGSSKVPSQENQLQLRPDRRPRPLTLRVRVGDCITVKLENLLFPTANPFNTIPTAVPPFNAQIDEQPGDRFVGFHAAGMQLVGSINDDGSMVGNNHLAPGADPAHGGLAGPLQTKQYKLYAEKEGVFLITSEGVVVGSDGNEGHIANGLFGQLIVEPKGAAIYRGQVHEEEMRLAADRDRNGVLDSTERTPIGQPILDYEAVYPAGTPWAEEGKAGLPILNMMKCTSSANCEIVHSEINAVVAYGGSGHTVVGNGVFPASTYPLESVGKRNPTLPNRLEPFRDFSSQFHDETVNAQAFPGFYVTDPVFKYVLAGVKDAFMINYGSGGIGSEIIANRLGVGPMHDCLDCAYEEFFLTSFTVGDPAMLVDVPANFGLETLLPADPRLATCGTATPDPVCAFFGPKASYAIGAEDPANISHSYTGDFTKIRNTHVGKEQHVFHLHNHQWLFNPNDDDSNYMDAQGIGPGAGYTYEINFGGSGNRNKTAGDSIYHCHFYPHFAQGMWYHWRHHDVFETGTVLAATGGLDNVTFVNDDPQRPSGYHTERWALENTTPAFHPKRGQLGLPADARYRSYPDGEVVAGTPIPAVVPLPGKPMPLMPGDVAVVPNPDNVAGTTRPVGSLAKVIERDKNPGFPFWIAGIEDIVGQRPTSPPLDMLSAAQAASLPTVSFPQYGITDLFKTVDSAQADGWDGGLPRHALRGYAAGGDADSIVSPVDFSKTILKAAPTYYPEEGTDLEKLAMAFHARKFHATYFPDGTNAGLDGIAGGFRTNGGGGPVVGAPYHNPCIDDDGRVLDTGVVGNFFSGESPTTDPKNTHGRSHFSSDNPRIYKGTFIQFDAVFNKVGYHYPQERILTLWADAKPVILKAMPPEPMVFRFNTFDCMVYHNSNLVPENFEMDDYQVRTPTDIIGQHIHLPKWDLTTADGSANGWNYEDGTHSPGAIRERIHAINEYVIGGGTPAVGTGSGAGFTAPSNLVAKPHPYFGDVANSMGADFYAAWLGARTTTQRWFADPVVNTAGFDRGLGIIFTHDHYGPSTHQQIGLYATALTEPAGSLWLHNETGTQLGQGPDGTGGRFDGGPTSWQAMILPPETAPEVPALLAGVNVKSDTIPPHREFYFEFSDFQHAYEKGVYVGADNVGLPLAGIGPGAGPRVANAGNPLFDGTPDNAFRFAINPPARKQIEPVFPDLVVEAAGGILPGCPARPCPQAISVEDPGMHVVNYRNEPVGLRVFDPARIGPDGKPGAQAAGIEGDLAYALSTAVIQRGSGNVTRINRAIPEMNLKEEALGFWTDNNARLNQQSAIDINDPFTPMMRTYAGDLVRVKMQAGGHEEEHNASIHGLKWLHTGSGNGRGLNSGWRNAQASGISEQFTLSIPLVGAVREFANCGVENPQGPCEKPIRDYAYSMDASMDGWWSGMWGILRAYDVVRPDLPALPDNPRLGVPSIVNRTDFRGSVCPINNSPTFTFDIVAALANDILPNPGFLFPTLANTDNVTGNPYSTEVASNTGSLKPDGGTLVYNPRTTVIPDVSIPADPGEPAPPPILGTQGPIHDPTAMMYVRATDLEATDNTAAACQGAPFYTLTGCRVQLKPGLKPEPLVLRAPAGSCVIVTLHNRIPAVIPDLPTFATIQGVVKRDRLGLEGSTTFNNNLIRPSSYVGLHPQLAAYDVTKDDGVNVGQNLDQVAAPVTTPGDVAKTDVYKWYLGDIGVQFAAGGGIQFVATPVEFGGSSLIPADKIKQGQKSLMGGIVTLPEGSTILSEDSGDNVPGSGHVAATVQKAGNPAPPPVRDFMVVMAKDLNHRDRFFSNNLDKPVAHMNGEGHGLPEDSQENSGMALNYGIEPLWFRFAVPPNAPFGAAGGFGYGAIPNAHQAFSNVLTGGNDPATPVLVASAGQEVRMHVVVPHSVSRGTTIAIHGHVWQRDPYVCPGPFPGTLEAQDGLAGRCNRPADGRLVDASGNWVVGSRALGVNPTGINQGGQESLTPYSHYDFFLPHAGGRKGLAGDYLFRDKASFGVASGLWGILRVQAEAAPPVDNVNLDFDADGKTDIAVWRPSDGTWWIQRSSGGVTVTQWGASGDVPVPGDYDNDAKTDIAVWRPSDGTWWIQGSSGGVTVTQWGASGDVPLKRLY